MATDPLSPEVLVSVTNEMEAAAIVNALAEHGIRARAIGGYTSGFRAEAPGEVKVVVGRADLARAEKVLAEIQSERAEVDWSTVDVANGQSPADKEEQLTSTDAEAAGGGHPATSERKRRPFQFSIANLLAVQTLVSMALAVWRGYHAGLLSAIVLFGGTYVVLIAATFALIVGGTVEVASDLNRAREAWRYVGRALTVGFVVLALFVLVARVMDTVGVTW